MNKSELDFLAMRAVSQLLQQQLVSVTHAAGWQRDGFPLPVKRMPNNADGSCTQDYRPLAILEYVHECLSGERQARRLRERHATGDTDVCTPD